MVQDAADYNPIFLSEMRLAGDSPADGFINKAFADGTGKTNLRQNLNLLTDNSKLVQLQEFYPDEQVLLQADHLPDWADQKIMKLGAAFFARHANLIMNLLGLLSLPYCYAAADGAMVLYLSERIRKDAGNRLFETAEFVWDVMAPDAFETTGKGFAAILKVRLMHAAVRYYTIRNDRWDATLGKPINQEDMAGTNLSFSLIVMRGLRKFGLSVNYDEQQSFLHLWNVIGSLLGLSDELIPKNGKDAASLEAAIRNRQFRVSGQGQALTQSLIDYFGTITTDPPFSSAETLQLMRYLMGNEVADILGIAPETIPANKVRLLKIANNLQLLKPSPPANIAYQKQYSQFKKQREQVIKALQD